MGVLASPPENPWNLHRTVTNALQVAIEKSELHFGGNCSIGFFFNLFLLSGASVAQLTLLLDVLLNVPKVEILQALRAQRLREQSQERLHEVPFDSLLFSELGLLDLDPLVANFLDLRRDLNRLTLEQERFTVWFIARHEGHSFVLEAEPLDFRVVNCGHLPRLIDDQVSYIWLLEINHPLPFDEPSKQNV